MSEHERIIVPGIRNDSKEKPYDLNDGRYNSKEIIDSNLLELFSSILKKRESIMILGGGTNLIDLSLKYAKNVYYVYFSKNELSTIIKYKNKIIIKSFHEFNTIKNMKFDLIIGNPPYKDESYSNELTLRNKVRGRNLAASFFIKSKKLSNEIYMLLPSREEKRKNFYTEKIYQGMFPGLKQEVSFFGYIKGKPTISIEKNTICEEVENSLYNRIRYARSIPGLRWDTRAEKVPKGFLGMNICTSKVLISKEGDIPVNRKNEPAYYSLIYAEGCEEKLKKYIEENSETIIKFFKENKKNGITPRITMGLKLLKDPFTNV